VFSQTQGPALLQVVKPSPNAAALEKYGDIPVSPFTGVPEISIPVYNITSGDISLPISLTYHASGIKVSEEASQVGLGWVLNAGGQISRNIIGYDDFLGNGYCTISGSSLKDYSNGQKPLQLLQIGCTLQSLNLSQPQLPTYNDNLTFYLEETDHYDFAPDQYYYNIPGKAGKFNLKRNKEVNLQKLEGIQISVMDADAKTWQIKTEDGFIYDFTENETYNDRGVNIKHYSAWFLTKITSPTNNSITFKYKHIYTDNLQSIGAYSETRDDAQTQPRFIDGAIITPMSNGNYYGEIFGKEYSTALLDTIYFNNGFVKFNYSPNREDIPGDQRLDSVNVYSYTSSNQNISLLKSSQFSYDYFTASGSGSDIYHYAYSSGNPSKRLKLLKITEKGYFNNQADSSTGYTFSYYDAGVLTLPPKNNFGKDHWGYWNGKSNTSLIPTFTAVQSPDWATFYLGIMGHERDPNINYVKAGALQAIKYNTGGSTEFEYESNDFDEQLSAKNDMSYFKTRPVLVAKSTSQFYDVAVGNHFVTTNSLDLSDGYSDKSVYPSQGTKAQMTVTYRFGKKFDYCPAAFQSGMVQFTILDSAGNNTNYFTKDLAYFNNCPTNPTSANYPCASCDINGIITYNLDLWLPPGKYTIQVNVNQSYAAGVNLQTIGFYTTYNAMVTSDAVDYDNSATFAYGGGLRIKKIIDHDGVDPSKDKIRHYVYHYGTDKNNDGINEEYSYGKRMSKPNYSYFVQTNDRTTVLIGKGETNYYYPTMHLTRSAESNTLLNGSSGGYAVGYSQVTELFGDNGENGKTVYQYYNEPDYVNAYNDPEFGFPIMPPYGSNYADPLNGSLLKKTIYKNANNVFYKVSEITNSYFSSFKKNNSLENIIYGIQPVKIRSNLSSVGGGYGPGSNSTGPGLTCSNYLLSYIAQNTEWTYLDSSIERTFAGNDTTKYLDVVTTYAYDNTKHFLPTKITRTSSNGNILITNYKYPLDFVISGTTNNTISKGIQNLQDKHVLSAVVERYIQSSGSVGLRTISGTFTAYKPSVPLPDTIFSLTSPSPITNFNASIITANAATMDDNYKPYLSFNQYSSLGNILEQQKVGDVKEVYLWGYNNQYPVAKIIGSDFNTINAHVDTSVLNTGSETQIETQLTALRNYFKNIPSVQIWTYTYTPLIGMTSQTDINNKTTYYEYDIFGRLSQIKDHDGNVIKKYDYHYKGQ
jgi:hypothetical protein